MAAPKEQTETPARRVRPTQRPAASVNMEELRELIALLRDNGLAELELAFADRQDRAPGAEMAAVVAPRHDRAQELAETLRRLGGVMHGDLDAVATVEHGSTIPQ